MRKPIQTIKERLADEIGSHFQHGPKRVAMLYPSPYRAGMSSLGYQWTIEILARSGFSVERVFLPDNVEEWKKSGGVLCSYETQTPLSHFKVVGISLAYELEMAGFMQCLELAGIRPLREERTVHDPIFILGGPITFSNPLPSSPFVNAMLLGEVEESIVPAFQAAFDSTYDGFLKEVQQLSGGFVPELDYPHLPDIAKATDSLLPARSHILTPHTELRNMFLIEGERGCHRSCTFCVMRRSTNGGMRLVTPERLMSFVPEHAKRVGLVGAAISDHPKLVPLLQEIVDSGREIGISSLRADRIARKPDIARLLRLGGYKTLTVASDAASHRLRKDISKGTLEKHLFSCAEQAKEHRYKVLKIYMMVGLPDETQEDLDELIRFALEISKIHPIVFGIAPFVPKKNTPLDTAEFAGIKAVDKKLKYIQKGLRPSKGRAQIRSTSAKWAWVEAMLAQGGQDSGLAVLEAVQNGGNFASWKRALGKLESQQQAPWRKLFKLAGQPTSF
jgi:radical SAM superfamily enzyme YgiQ (UPF0313 family)